MADERRNNLLKVIVEEYIQSASPVGSNFIADKYFEDISSATIRNDMVELESEGLIYQPHTSAGRIPTIAGYQYYLDHFVQNSILDKKSRGILDRLVEKLSTDREGSKELAKGIAEISKNAVLIGFAPNDVYYTGISNMFRQPEFNESASVYNMSDIIDHLDDVMGKIFHNLSDEVEVLIGDENPFGVMSAVVISKYNLAGQECSIGILGPTRMDYGQGVSLINYAKELFKK